MKMIIPLLAATFIAGATTGVYFKPNRTIIKEVQIEKAVTPTGYVGLNVEGLVDEFLKKIQTNDFSEFRDSFEITTEYGLIIFEESRNRIPKSIFNGYKLEIKKTSKTDKNLTSCEIELTSTIDQSTVDIELLIGLPRMNHLKMESNKTVDTTRVSARRNPSTPDTLNPNPTFEL